LIKSYIYIGNWWFLDRIKDSLDFIGLNYYFTEYRNWWGKTANPKSPINDLGWYMEPSGIYPLLIKLWNRYKKPIIITENGLADAKDTHRQWWLQETIQALQKALADGVDLRGYLHWSLLDNFEWAYGWWPKFGLVAVDRETMRRTLRPSAKWLAKTIKTTCSKK
jgi:beta-glucosidase